MTGTRKLLVCGIVGALLFIVVIAVNGVIKPDYDPMNDFVSEGAIGPGGWLQIANFVVSGGLLTAFSFGLRRTVSRWTAWLTGIFAVSLVGAGVFVSDPVPSDRASGHGVAHDLFSLVVFVALIAACFTAARWRPTPLWRWYCRFTGVAVGVLVIAAGGVDPVDGGAGLLQRGSILIGWSWLAVLAWRARPVREVTVPHRPATVPHRS
ncbi:DUF998 domain-containing protein [Micromonospora sp. FIMYZ51]|uniref:DUF998 domain-containing protein n=1 Tax=Micromonospora sp. FIMYZ51 TaxID=3051832 RepID=UPI00311DB008